LELRFFFLSPAELSTIAFFFLIQISLPLDCGPRILFSIPRRIFPPPNSFPFHPLIRLVDFPLPYAFTLTVFLRSLSLRDGFFSPRILRNYTTLPHSTLFTYAQSHSPQEAVVSPSLGEGPFPGGIPTLLGGITDPLPLLPLFYDSTMLSLVSPVREIFPFLPDSSVRVAPPPSHYSGRAGFFPHWSLPLCEIRKAFPPLLQTSFTGHFLDSRPSIPGIFLTKLFL